MYVPISPISAHRTLIPNLIPDQSPPKRDLKVSDPAVKNLTLAELQLAPSSILLLRFEDESLNGSNVPAPLDPSLISQAVELPVPPDFDTAPSKGATPAAASNKPSSSSATGSGEKKVPKWFKGLSSKCLSSLSVSAPFSPLDSLYREVKSNYTLDKDICTRIIYHRTCMYNNDFNTPEMSGLHPSTKLSDPQSRLSRSYRRS